MAPALTASSPPWRTGCRGWRARRGFAAIAKQPSFAHLTTERVAAQITMVAGHNGAWSGFHTSEIHVVLTAGPTTLTRARRQGYGTVDDQAEVSPESKPSTKINPCPKTSLWILWALRSDSQR